MSVGMERSVAGILLRNCLFFIARRPPGGSMGLKWEFPGGKVEDRETEEEALSREFMEEFGARIRIARRLGEESFHHRGKQRLLAAWLISLEPGSVLETREHVEQIWVTRDDLESYDLADSDRKLLPMLRRYIPR
jgi:8-oxo-dGTP diphosphatase